MITNLANSIAHFFVKKGWGRNEKLEIYRYGCEVIISTLTSVTLVAVCGIIFKMVGAAFLFYFCLLILRRYCGGFHADTYLLCNTIFTFSMLFVLFGISQYDRIPVVVLVIATCISFLIIVRSAPISHKNKPLLDSEVVLYRNIAICISGILLILVMVLLLFDRRIATIISLAMLTTASLMLVSVIMERGERHER